MGRVRCWMLWAVMGLAAVSLGVAAAQGPGNLLRDPQRVRVFEGSSTRGIFQEALNGAVAQALRALPGADRTVRYRVREITGEQGGIAGRNVVRVSIEIEGGRPGPRPDRPGEEGADAGPLTARLRVLPDRERPGQAVNFELTVRNPTREPVRVPFASGQQYDFEVRDGDRMLWRWSQGRVFPQVLSIEIVEAGVSMTFTGNWDLRDPQGRRVPAGDYDVRAWLTSRDRDLRVEATGRFQVAR